MVYFVACRLSFFVGYSLDKEFDILYTDGRLQESSDRVMMLHNYVFNLLIMEEV